jgi:hypothetical protein
VGLLRKNFPVLFVEVVVLRKRQVPLLVEVGVARVGVFRNPSTTMTRAVLVVALVPVPIIWKGLFCVQMLVEPASSTIRGEVAGIFIRKMTQKTGNYLKREAQPLRFAETGHLVNMAKTASFHIRKTLHVLFKEITYVQDIRFSWQKSAP